MQYLLLIYTAGADGAHEPAEIDAKMLGDYAFTEEVRSRGEYKGGEALQPVVDGDDRVRVEDGHTVTTDGPFAETKEFLGGYYQVDVADLDRGHRPTPP